MNDLPKSKIRLVLVLCFALFLLNVAWLVYLQHSGLSEFRSSPCYPIYRDVRSLMLSPFGILSTLVFVGYGLYWVFKPRKKPVSEIQRLAVLAVVAGTILGFILAFLFKL